MATTSCSSPLTSTAALSVSQPACPSSKRFLPFPSRPPRPRWLPQEWRKFEDAVESKYLSRALRFLQSVEPASYPEAAANAVTQVALPLSPGRGWEVLDTCIDADDMRLIGRAYQFLSDCGVLANFGKCKNIVLEGPREVTPTILKEMRGLEGVLVCAVGKSSGGLGLGKRGGNGGLGGAAAAESGSVGDRVGN